MRITQKISALVVVGLTLVFEQNDV